MNKLLTTFSIAGLLVLATPAWAEPAHDDGHGHGADDGHGHAAPKPAAHGAAAGHDGGHGDAKHGAGAHHVSYTGDDDGDGTANWMDLDNGAAGILDAPVTKVGLHAINLLLFLGVLGYFGRRPIADALANRAFSIKKELKDSAAVRDAARARNDELGARLGKIEAEITAMRENAEREALNQGT